MEVELSRVIWWALLSGERPGFDGGGESVIFLGCEDGGM